MYHGSPVRVSAARSFAKSADMPSMALWSRAPKSFPVGGALSRTFHRPSGGLLCFAQGDVVNFCGDALAVSTSQALEGIERADWWGFAGRASADAALHMKMKGLAKECRKQRTQLDFAEVLVTPGPSQVSQCSTR